MKIFNFRNNSSQNPVSGDMDGKQKRFDALVRGLYADLYRYAYWLCKNQAIAEDLVQDIF